MSSPVLEQTDISVGGKSLNNRQTDGAIFPSRTFLYFQVKEFLRSPEPV